MVIGLDLLKILTQYTTTSMIVDIDENLFNRYSKMIWLIVITKVVLRTSEFIVSNSFWITVNDHVWWSWSRIE